MTKVVGIRFKKAGKIYYFDPLDFDLKVNDKVIVETARGFEYGNVVVGIKEVEESQIVHPLKPIVRIATDEDKAINKENKEKSKEAFDICIEKIKKHNLDMNLIDCEYTFDRNKLIFYFTAEGRIDFRELVKDLASIFKTRIELRQIGVRDEAKSIGGLGPCGVSLCCSTWLGDFQPVSIKMAKDQELSLNPTKISGICGRLFCCLKYEHQTYSDILENMPPVNSIVQTPDGQGKVIDIYTLEEKVKVQFEGTEKKEGDIKDYKLEDIKIIKKSNECGGCCKDNLDKELEEELKKLED
ncbi:Cell fate regulator YaaT, PSP1 superfamily (controls sporulation, competence, biofilm development) [Alkalithermobacter thermoalcaliphilus JW-YL-7 = DSM 7308]|uniref:Cell fate regulator YaaT, PSP1 superfamily (Controls sporulation, competence, biofilm development) n=1 Tax=Alkalithermobacter thermoalcaliphilus JW-YL-7 = DSM 7308 TaxID=1121328 RepID=A0A150FSR5_CLOPD|nr:PSP1 domain protein [[Clostridium] paradoxum JW-YL-7 = DSM 7308]SHL20035.1 Cell fate regulator YaaT, PSP1 superfamily (controls sporulation, competence, biofilm development) [[Clostridium] paradoxum JW-YL-7 = DSM 7308]